MEIRKIIQTCCAAALVLVPLTVLHAKPTGSLTTESGVYTWSPTICGMYKEDDFYDIEVHGPGTAPEGDKVYMELSSTADAMTVKLGVDSMFQSSDFTLDSVGTLHIKVDGKKIYIDQIELVDQDRRVVDTKASLKVDCSFN